MKAPNREQALDALPPRLASIPIRIPVVNGMASFPASSIIASRSSGFLSGALACGHPRLAEPLARVLEHESEAHVHLLEPLHVARGQRRPAFVCGSRPCSSARNPRRMQVRDRPVMTPAFELGARYVGKTPSGLSPRQKRASTHPTPSARASALVDLRGRHRPCSRLTGGATEGAVAAAVLAEIGQRQEDLRRERDPSPHAASRTARAAAISSPVAPRQSASRSASSSESGSRSEHETCFYQPR